MAPAIHVGAVEQGDATVDGMMDDADCFGVVAPTVGARQRHAAEPNGENGQVAVAERTCGHGNPLIRHGVRARMGHHREKNQRINA